MLECIKIYIYIYIDRYIYLNIYIYIHKIMCLSHPPYGVSQPMADKKSYKKCLEFENNMVSCTTFAGWPTLLAGQTIHV